MFNDSNFYTASLFILKNKFFILSVHNLMFLLYICNLII